MLGGQVGQTSDQGVKGSSRVVKRVRFEYIFTYYDNHLSFNTYYQWYFACLCLRRKLSTPGFERATCGTTHHYTHNVTPRSRKVICNGSGIIYALIYGISIYACHIWTIICCKSYMTSIYDKSIYDKSYVDNHMWYIIWQAYTAESYMMSHIWTTICCKSYMTDIYDKKHIWWIIYEQPYMIIIYLYHMRIVPVTTVYDYHIWQSYMITWYYCCICFCRIWRLYMTVIYEYPYMIVTYDDMIWLSDIWLPYMIILYMVTVYDYCIWFTVYDFRIWQVSYMVNNIWVTIYGFVYMIICGFIYG